MRIDETLSLLLSVAVSERESDGVNNQVFKPYKAIGDFAIFL